MTCFGLDALLRDYHRNQHDRLVYPRNREDQTANQNEGLRALRRGEQTSWVISRGYATKYPSVDGPKEQRQLPYPQQAQHPCHQKPSW